MSWSSQVKQRNASDVNARFDSATAATCRSSSLVIYMGSFFDY
jgi:hypothetical protein